MVHIDENGDAEGNYTVLALQPDRHNSSKHGLYPVAIFTKLPETQRNLPVILQCLAELILNRRGVTILYCESAQSMCLSMTKKKVLNQKRWAHHNWMGALGPLDPLLLRPCLTAFLSFLFLEL